MRGALDLIRRLRVELAQVGLAPDLDVVDLASGRWAGGSSRPVPPDWGSTGFLVALPTGWHLCGDGPDLDVGALTELAEQVQEWAIDELWRGWPDPPADAGSAAPMAPRVGPDGAWWWAGGRPVRPIGEVGTRRAAGEAAAERDRPSVTPGYDTAGRPGVIDHPQT